MEGGAGASKKPFDLDAWAAGNPEPEPAPPAPAAHPNGLGDGRGNGHHPAPATHHADGRLSPLDRCRMVIFGPGFLDSIAGQEGHKQLYHVAAIIWNDFGLGDDVGLPLFREWNRAKAQPPESDYQVQHKWESVRDRYPTPSLKMLNEPNPKYEAWARQRQENRAVAAAFAGVHPNGNGNGFHAPAPPPIPPVDVADLIARADALISESKAKVESLYRSDEILADLARLEILNPAEAEAIKATLARLSGFKSRAFNAAMKPFRDPYQPPKGGGFGPAPQPGQDADAGFALTDLGNGQRLVSMFGDRVRFCKAYGDWLIYDGKRWNIDDLLEIEKMSQAIPAQVKFEMPATPSEEVQNAYRDWATKSQSKERLEAAVKTARSMVPVTPKQLDPDPWMLNVQNGTLDLKTGDFRAHDSRDQITKISNVSYVPGAQCPTWDRFILEIMKNDEGLAAYLRRSIGYAITGVIREHAFFFLYGTGRNGKTTFLNTILNILGDYSNTIDAEFLLSQNLVQHPTWLTDLEGRRFICADETDDDRRLAEAQVKKLTGGNMIRARRMHEDFYTFKPSHHLFFAANHKPEIRGTDPAIWRRVKIIPFEVSFDTAIPGGRKPDLDLESKLMAEAPGILNWMLRGCRDWQENGLDEPPTVQSAVTDYRQEMDTLGSYVEERCIIDLTDSERVKANILYGDYCSWCETAKIRPVSIRKFGAMLSDKGFGRDKSNSIVFRTGLRLKTPVELMADESKAEQELEERARLAGQEKRTGKAQQEIEEGESDDVPF